MLPRGNTYPSERDHVESIFSAINGIQEVIVGDLGTRKNLQLTVETKGSTSVINIYKHSEEPEKTGERKVKVVQREPWWLLNLAPSCPIYSRIV